MTDPNWGWNDDSNYNAGYNMNQYWQQKNEPWRNQGVHSNQPMAGVPSDKAYNQYYNQQANIPAVPMTTDYYQASQKQPFGVGMQNSYDIGNLSSFSGQFMSDPMLNAAKHISGQFAIQQKKKVLFLPLLGLSVKYDSSGSPVPPRSDVNAPDLYIPLMAYVTYILISGFVLGTQKRFTPEQLGIITTNALAYLIFENLIITITRYIMNISESLTFWHSLAYSGYKFVGMNVCLLVFVLGGKSFYYWVLAYVSCAVLRTVKTFLMDVQNAYNEYGGRKRKVYLMLFIAFTQPFLLWWLTSSVTSYTPGKMDLAQLALSGIGFSEAISKGQLPLMPDGEVDYEALLKMP
ncbi:Protein YIF1A [Dirofilaria immitis]|nr:Protein YIF1A [Dirofilaria immitis]